MISADGLRRLLAGLLEKTASGEAVKSPCHWAADLADARRVRDDGQSGRLHLRSAYRAVRKGIAALDRGEDDAARTYYESALSFYIEAIERQLRPSDHANLGKSAGKRGRPRKEEKPAVPARKRGRPKK
jgi:hypothetical protein